MSQWNYPSLGEDKHYYLEGKRIINGDLLWIAIDLHDRIGWAQARYDAHEPEERNAKLWIHGIATDPPVAVAMSDQLRLRRKWEQPLSSAEMRAMSDPVKRALTQYLEYMDEGTVAFRGPDGQPISTREMCDMLKRDDPMAIDFLYDVYAAAVRAVRVKSKKDLQ